ncbi:MAG: FAD-dependent oxidoreductase, partial [Pseudomonadota bacterium]
VVGAGVAGLSAARRLSDQGHTITVFDKGRSLGGRLSTRAHGELRFDHGAPHVHADRPAFSHLLDQLKAAGSAEVWPSDQPNSVTGLPSMNTLLAPLTRDLELVTSTAISSVVRGADGWTLGIDGGTPRTGFDAVVIAIPAEQADTLTATLGLGWSEHLGAVTYDPCMTMMVAFTEPAAISDSALPRPGHDLAKQVRNSAKPDRPDAPDQWVVHADLAWSQLHLNTSKEEIADALLERFAAANAISLPEYAYLAGHRWRFARVANAMGRSHLYDPALKIGVAGDWCLGPNAEHAFESGLLLADTIATDLAR